MSVLQDMINHAALGSWKVNKQEASRVLREFLADVDEETLSKHPEVVQLLAFFYPPRPAKSRNEWEWVAKAVADRKSEDREYLWYVYSDGNRIMATDGKLLHLFQTGRYPEGYYDPRTGDKITCIKREYPDIDRIIPNVDRQDEMFKVSLTPESVKEVIIDGKPVPYALFDGVPLRLDELRKVFSFNKGADALKSAWAFTRDRKSPVLVDLDYDRLAIVCPLNLPE